MKTALIDGDIIAVKSAAIAARDEASQDDACELAAGMIAKWTVQAECERTLVCISCKGPTFRHKIYPGYKLGRPSKPSHTSAVYDFMRANYWYAQVPELEADDVLGILGTRWADSVIITIDKDLLGVPGWHLNPDTDTERHYINPDKAMAHEWLQWIVGDSTDKIPGIRGVGPKKAAPILAEALEHGEQVIIDAYPDPETATLMRQLVHILRASDFPKHQEYNRVNTSPAY